MVEMPILGPVAPHDATPPAVSPRISQSGIFLGFIPFWLGWEMVFFLTREIFFARQRDEKKMVFFLVFFGVFVFLGGVFVLCGVFFCFSRVSASLFFLFFFGGGMSKTGNSRSGISPNDVSRTEREFVRAQWGAGLPRGQFSGPWLFSTA